MSLRRLTLSSPQIFFFEISNIIPIEFNHMFNRSCKQFVFLYIPRQDIFNFNMAKDA
jgi:hypothetical protein